LVMNIFGSVLAIFLANSLGPKWVTVGLAGALSVSYLVGAWTTIRLLRRYSIDIHIGEIVGLYTRLAGIYLVIALPLRFFLRFIPGGNTLHLLVVLLVTGFGYLGAARVFKIEEVASAFSLLLRR